MVARAFLNSKIERNFPPPLKKNGHAPGLNPRQKQITELGRCRRCCAVDNSCWRGYQLIIFVFVCTRARLEFNALRNEIDEICFGFRIFEFLSGAMT